MVGHTRLAQWPRRLKHDFLCSMAPCAWLSVGDAYGIVKTASRTSSGPETFVLTETLLRTVRKGGDRNLFSKMKERRERTEQDANESPHR